MRTLNSAQKAVDAVANQAIYAALQQTFAVGGAIINTETGEVIAAPAIRAAARQHHRPGVIDTGPEPAAVLYAKRAGSACAGAESVPFQRGQKRCVTLN